MASRQDEEFSVRAGQIVGQAHVKRDECNNSSQASSFLQQKGEKVKNMAQEASEAVKNKLGMNNDNNNEYRNKNPLDKKNPNNTTSPSMPGHPPSDI
ncbi:PREDICTED: late embryogenesis abundant protein 1-like [Camelina sativa]|uniref:Late embryogenesis abundant protein 1-like n=1 Tax=Camelina sativa TaxID=90675 RepID=A0ABM0WV60_CAMSA|nr:PREDICTED: late embryogenesis abundant protein 1-like [Camelina sativa]